MVASSLHFWWELYQQRGSDDFVQPAVRGVWENYLDYVTEMSTPEDRRYQQIHEGHCTFGTSEDRRCMVPELIRASGGLVGEPAEIIEMLRERESAGLKEVTLLPPMASARRFCVPV